MLCCESVKPSGTGRLKEMGNVESCQSTVQNLLQGDLVRMLAVSVSLQLCRLFSVHLFIMTQQMPAVCCSTITELFN